MKHFAFFLSLIALSVVASAQPNCDSVELSDAAREQCETGQADAAADLASGVPEWHWFGIPDITTSVADSLLRVRYGLGPVFHGDVVFDYEDHYAVGYNGVIRDRLAPRFGSDFASRAFNEARAYFPGHDVLNPEVVRGIPAPAGACGEAERCAVIVGFEIAPNGEPSDLRVLRSVNAELDGLALAAASHVRFQPASNMENARSGGGYAVPVTFLRE